jgi:ribonuclease D
MSDEHRKRRPPQRLDTPILVTDEPALDALVAQALQSAIAGVDTESNSLYAYHYRICLLQLSLPEADYIVDPLACDISVLEDLFADSRCQKIFHAAENDIIALKRDFGFSFANIIDTMLAARILGWPRAGLAAILAEHFDVPLNKRMQRTNWGQRPLTAEQLAYAQLDTHYLLPLWDRQARQLRERGRWREAMEAFAALPDVEGKERSFDPDGFWSINGARDLEPRELGVLRELFLFGEQEAQRLDRPPFKVLDQSAMLAISRQQPVSLAALQTMPGISRHHVRRLGHGILSAVSRGRAAQPPEPPRRKPNSGSRPDPATLTRYEALRSWRSERARQRGVDPDVVLTNDQLMTLARLAPTSVPMLATSGVMGAWKVEEYGEAILRVLGGVSA